MSKHGRTGYCQRIIDTARADGDLRVEKEILEEHFRLKREWEDELVFAARKKGDKRARAVILDEERLKQSYISTDRHEMFRTAFRDRELAEVISKHSYPWIKVEEGE